MKAIYDLTKDIGRSILSLGKSEVRKLSVDLETGFAQFLDRNLRQYSQIKTLLNPLSPIPLEQTFVSPTLLVENRRYREDGFLSLLEINRFFVVTGQGGSGKSILLKHLFVRYYNEPRGRIPFLVELRNKPTDLSLENYLRSLLEGISPSFDETLFRYALKSGKFAFLLDGFDEVEASKRDDLAKEIIHITYAYEKNIVVLTSRPDPVFPGWTEFHTASMEGFTRAQAVSLIRKLPYDNKAKNKLVQYIQKRGLYASHGSYLANPLLCTIMLLTFDQVAEIANKMHLFYSQTFDVLFYRHDAAKGTAFRRKFNTGLSIDDFRSVLAAFSCLTYIDDGASISRQNAIAAANKALQLSNFQENSAEFIKDLCMSVSILINEGDNYSYIHRSFQEYFVAIFLSTCDIPNWGETVEQFQRERPNDSVVPLLRDLNRDRFDNEFLLPRLKRLCDALESIDIEATPSRAFLLFYLNIQYDRRGIRTWTLTSGHKAPSFYYITRFLRHGSDFISIDDFDWVAHDERRHLKGEDNNPARPDGSYFIDTPMVGYLNRLKTSAFMIRDEIEQRGASQRNLLASVMATAFPKIPSSSL